jgi:hypothetical protein
MEFNVELYFCSNARILSYDRYEILLFNEYD